ncbi:MAG: hypothetical protein R2793_01020 [Flavobacteriaceae bacterium]
MLQNKKHIAFTICSNNYLGQALALKKSFLKHNPNFGFYIVLVDQRSEAIDYSQFEPAYVLPVEAVEGIDLQDLIARYYIIELNTSVKPTVFKYLAKVHPEATTLYYLDPDLYFYASLEKHQALLESHSAVLTPHILSPIPRDGKQPDENTFFRFGIYNLGFLGINPRHPETQKLLDWWEERVLMLGYDRPNKGYFVDQLWMTLAPLLFKDIFIEPSFGYNMAPWNLHERHIVKREGNTIILNDDTPLVFYHFSKIAEEPDAISREYDRYTLKDFPMLRELYDHYKNELVACHFSEYKKIPIAYPVKMSLKKEPQKDSLLSKSIKKLARMMNEVAKKV